MFKVADPKFNNMFRGDPVADADDIWFEFESDTVQLLRKYLNKFEGLVVQELLRDTDTCSAGFTCLYTQEAEALKTDNFPPLSVVLTVDDDAYLLDPIDDFLNNLMGIDLGSSEYADGYLKKQLSTFLQELKEVQQQVEKILTREG